MEKFLLVEGSVNLVDHVLESLRLIENGAFLYKSLGVVKELGFIKTRVFFDGAVKVKFTDIFIIQFLYRIPDAKKQVVL